MNLSADFDFSKITDLSSEIDTDKLGDLSSNATEFLKPIFSGLSSLI